MAHYRKTSTKPEVYSIIFVVAKGPSHVHGSVYRKFVKFEHVVFKMHGTNAAVNRHRVVILILKPNPNINLNPNTT